jgi:hypothetical protein
MKTPAPGRFGGRVTRSLVVLALATAAVLTICSPATALRPRTTPANAARLASRQSGGSSPRTALLHERTLARILVRHRAAGAGSPAVSTAGVHQTRMHRAVALNAQGALAVGTLAALSAIILVVVAVMIGERRQVAGRREADAARPSPVHRHQAAS